MRLPPGSMRSLRRHKARSGSHTIIPPYIVMIPNYDRGTIRFSSWRNFAGGFRIERFRIVNMEIEMLFSRWFL
jgi:hypothetical protein